jgi:acetoacetate decarboxylase
MYGKPRICELVRYRRQDVRLKGAWGGPAALQLFAHALVNVAKLPVLDVLSGTHFVADVTVGIGEVVHDFLAPGNEAPIRDVSLAAAPMQ